MEDLQAALQSVLSDPAQMAQIAALAESLGLKQPEAQPGASEPHPSERGEDSASRPRPSGRSEEAAPPAAPVFRGLPGIEGLDLSRLMAGLSAVQGREDQILGALRSSLAPSGQAKADRAVRAAKLARLAGQLLRRGRKGHV